MENLLTLKLSFEILCGSQAGGITKRIIVNRIKKNNKSPTLGLFNYIGPQASYKITMMLRLQYLISVQSSPCSTSVNYKMS